ncbi:MAG: UDP-N-acetylmuramyl-tripeptide synthetase [Solirubrobacterales bacterium]|nr:UDP-N-acetylmuramyl-tripeptide synthetase [Solirubrobacterales bacterium]
MQLHEILGEGPPVEISHLAHDTRDVRDGTLFFCVPGFTRDGHDLAPEAIEKGAVALVVERPLDAGVPEVAVPSVRAAMAPAAAAFHGDPTRTLPVAGITGTNGKTTTAFLLRGLLEAAGRQTGLLGTVTSWVGGEQRPTVRTTPEAIELQATFAQMLAGGDRACAIEVSSHALALHRADAIHWAVAVFTNLTQDHLDFHADMEDYFAAKRRLFEAGPAAMVINVEDPYGARLAADFPHAVTVGFGEEAEVRAEHLDGDASGTTFTVDGHEHRVALPGRFNVLNALCAVAAARALGIDDRAAAQALARVGAVPGRFEPVDEGQGFTVIVDYSHTPDSLDNALRAARDLAGGRVYCVFGAGGDRDRAKRPLMGRVAAELADVAIVTSDNPRSEDPQAIIDEVMAGTGQHAQAIADRRDAIFHAIRMAEGGDVVLIAGKGHEQGQELADGEKVPFDDVTVAREALRARLVF